LDGEPLAILFSPSGEPKPFDKVGLPLKSVLKDQIEYEDGTVNKVSMAILNKRYQLRITNAPTVRLANEISKLSTCELTAFDVGEYGWSVVLEGKIPASVRSEPGQWDLVIVYESGAVQFLSSKYEPQDPGHAGANHLQNYDGSNYGEVWHWAGTQNSHGAPLRLRIR
jgi:hypothetical protein